MITFDVKTNLIDPHLLKLPCSRAETIIANQVLKDTTPFVPALNMSLAKRAHVVSNQVIYPGPYARYLYYGKVMVDSVTGKGPANIPGVGYRFRKGATLKPTDRNLVFTKTVHPQAQAYWFEASKKQNLEKWLVVAKKAVTDNF